MKITLIGSGNVATVLGRLLVRANHEIVNVVSRNTLHAEILAQEFKALHSNIADFTDDSSDFYIIALADNGIAELESNIHVNNKPVVHTAGSVSKDVLKNLSPNHGVLYPLQSLRKESKEVPSIPFLIDASNRETLELIQSIAGDISNQVVVAGDEERLKIHVAAVVVNNFTNHLFALAERYCKTENLDFNLLRPLIQETAERMKDKSPSSVQTGPALRNDVSTIDHHLALLSSYPELKSVYQKLTESIMSFNREGK